MPQWSTGSARRRHSAELKRFSAHGLQPPPVPEHGNGRATARAESALTNRLTFVGVSLYRLHLVSLAAEVVATRITRLRLTGPRMQVRSMPAAVQIHAD